MNQPTYQPTNQLATAEIYDKDTTTVDTTVNTMAWTMCILITYSLSFSIKLFHVKG